MKDNSDYFNQFWLGNITLWKSYWIWGTAFSFVVGFILGIIGVLLQAPFIIVIGIIALVYVWFNRIEYASLEIIGAIVAVLLFIISMN